MRFCTWIIYDFIRDFCTWTFVCESYMILYIKNFFHVFLKSYRSRLNIFLYIYIYIYIYTHTEREKRIIREWYLFKKIQEPIKIIHDFTLNFGKNHVNDYDCKLQKFRESSMILYMNHIWFCLFLYSFKHISFSFEPTLTYVCIISWRQPSRRFFLWVEFVVWLVNEIGLCWPSRVFKVENSIGRCISFTSLEVGRSCYQTKLLNKLNNFL